MDKNYGGVIWTNHSLQRLGERGIKQGDAWATWRNPEQSRFAANKGAWIYYRTYNGQRIEVVAKQNEKKEWIILSVWSKRVSDVVKTKKSFWKIIFGGYIDLMLPIIASILFISFFAISAFFPISKINDNVLTSPIPTFESTPSQSPTPTPEITPIPKATDVATPKATSVPTPSITINNVPPGAGYSRQSVKTDVGTFTVSLIAADISSTRVIVDTASSSDCSSNCPALSLSDYIARNGGFAGVNGSYFCPIDYPSCAGKENTFDLLVMNKDKYYFNSGNNVYSTNPAVIFGSGYIRFVSSASQWGRDTGVNGVIMNYPLLVFNGNVSFGGDDDPKKGSKGSRSFVANRGNTVYIGVVHSATVAESARVLKALSMDNAINLDNGGSTALWYGGYKVGPGRAIPNAIIFTK